jgi:hypothetical protein
LTRVDDIECVHEPFSDAYHWGPEKLTERYENVEQLRAEKGYGEYTYHTALDLINNAKLRVSIFSCFVSIMGRNRHGQVCMPVELPGISSAFLPFSIRIVCHLCPSLSSSLIAPEM